MAKHTPGPWKLANSGFANAPSVIFTGEKSPNFGAKYPLQGCDWIAEVKEDESPRGREYHANARLIAAAPELLEACQIALWIRDKIQERGGFGATFEEWDVVEAAIRKAKGEVERG